MISGDGVQLELLARGRLAWREQKHPELQAPHEAIVRPFLAGRCDGDTLPLRRRVSRPLQLGIALGVVDPVVGCICGRVPFKPPFAIGHECVAEVIEVGSEVAQVRVRQRVVVPWAISCGHCDRCRRGLTSKCATTTDRTLAAFGFGQACGPWGGMIADAVLVPHADHMLVPVPDAVPSLRVAAASDNLADAWRSVVGPLAERPGGSVLILGGGAKSIGLYAAGLATAHGASVTYVDPNPRRRAIAEEFGASARTRSKTTLGGRYDIIVEATSTASGLRQAIRALAPGGVCTAVGYYMSSGTRVPLMHMYATDGSLRLGVSHARAILPELLSFIERRGFPAERVTTTTADWQDAPRAYGARTTKLVLQRDPLARSR